MKMEVFVSEKDKDFIDACLSETNCYLYIQDELQGEILKLKSLDQHDAEVRKHVIAELEEFENEHRLRARVISEEYPTYNEEQKARLYALSSGRFEILGKLKQKLNEMKGEKQ